MRGTRTLCPRCLLAGTVAESASEISATSPPVTIEVPAVEDLQAAFPELLIKRLIGVGGMGVVYEAVQRALGRMVALKILRLESVNLEFTERFKREAKALAKLNHTNIVSIFDQGEQGGWYFILMEYVEGTDLSRMLDAGLLPLEQAAEIADSIFAALTHAHEQGVVHRDIKPANVLLDRAGVVKIADFGLAKYSAGQQQDFSLTTGGSSLGTPLYMAPEQRKGAADADSRADIYAASVVLYEMLTGEIPVGRVRPPSEAADLPAALDEVVLKGIEPDPGRRFASAHEMRLALKRALDADPAPRGGLPLIAKISAVLVIGALAVAMWPRDRAGGGNRDSTGGDEGGERIATVVGAPVPALSPVRPLPELLEVLPDAPSVIALTAEQPAASTYFGSIIEAGADILAIGYCKTEPLQPGPAPPGEVHVYQIGADGIPAESAVLRAAVPTESDHFGRYVAVSPLGDFIAVVSSEKGAGESDGEAIGSCVTIFDRQEPGTNRWDRAATFYVEKSFEEGRFAMRVTASIDLVTLGAPELNEGVGAVRMFERGDGQEWRQLEDLVPGDEDDHSNFGATSVRDPSGEFLVVSASSYDVGIQGNEGKIVTYQRDDNGGWERLGEILDEEPQNWELFGFELRASGDSLAVSVPGDRLQGVMGAGGIVMLELDRASPTGWRRVTTLRPPLTSPRRVGFGGRFDLANDWLAAMTLQTEDSGATHSLVYVARRHATTGAWEYLATISGAPDNNIWMGRVVLGDGFVACGHPTSDVGDEAEAGKVYVFPKTLFTPAQPLGHSKIRQGSLVKFIR